MTDKEFIEQNRKTVERSAVYVAKQCLAEALDRLEESEKKVIELEVWTEQRTTIKLMKAEARVKVLEAQEAGLREVLKATRHACDLLMRGTYENGDLITDSRMIVSGMAGEIDAVLSVPAPQTSAERDYTPEEAFAKARRLLGPFAYIRVQEEEGILIYCIREKAGGKSFDGKSFRAAFAEADKAPKTGGDK